MYKWSLKWGEQCSAVCEGSANDNLPTAPKPLLSNAGKVKNKTDSAEDDPFTQRVIETYLAT